LQLAADVPFPFYVLGLDARIRPEDIAIQKR